MLNFFAANEERETISFQEIGDLSCRIVKKCDNAILTKTSFDDILRAISMNDDLFEMQDVSVKLIKRTDYRLQNVEIVNLNMPVYVKESVQVCVSLSYG
ncbi:MAG: hypothetical protein LBI82_02075 [Dysgonamonadaceae bacterium]|nr:hypothetical protein [Dysgonamonadaceae bacterium]